jgi:hypothetical protein
MAQPTGAAAAYQGLGEEDMPALYQGANSSSLDGQSNFINATKIRLWALLVAAAAGVMAGEFGPPDGFALVGVVAFLAAMGLEIYLLAQRPERVWYEGRAAAESAKSLAWRYAVGGEPFGIGTPNADELFQQRLREILTDLDISLDVGPDAGEQITPAMRNLRAERLDQRRFAYRIDRIEDQRDWYQRKAIWNATRAKRLHIAAIALEVVGVTAGILTVTATVRVDLLGIFAAATASVVAWLQTKQHETLAKSYGITAQELAGVRSAWEAELDENAWAEFVDKAEEAISREHKLWRASRGVEARWEKRQA